MNPSSELPIWVVCYGTVCVSAERNRTSDEEAPFEIGRQGLISSHRRLLPFSAMVLSVAETRDDIQPTSMLMIRTYLVPVGVSRVLARLSGSRVKRNPISRNDVPSLVTVLLVSGQFLLAQA